MEESVPPDSTTSVSLKERQRVINDICKQGGMVVMCETVVTVLRNDQEKEAWEVVDYGIPGVVANENELIVCVGDYESGEIVHQFNIDSNSDYRAFKDHFHVFSSHRGSLAESFGLSFADVSVAKKILSAVKQLVPQVGTGEENGDTVPPAKRQKVEEEEGENGVGNDKQTTCDEDWVIIEPEDIPPQAKEDTPPHAKEEDTPPQAKEEDTPPQAKEEDTHPQAKEDTPPQAKEEDTPPQAKEDTPPQAKEEDTPPEGEEEVDVPFGIRKSFRRKKVNTEESAAMEISAPTDFKHVSHVGSETSIVQLTAAISGSQTEIEGGKAEAETITRPPEPVVSETKQPSIPPPPPQLALTRKRTSPKTKVPPLPIVGVNLPEPPPISDHDALLQEVIRFDRTKLRRVTLEDIACTKNMPDSEGVSLHSLLKSGLDKMRGKLQLSHQTSRMASITSNGAEEGFDDFDFPLFEE